MQTQTERRAAPRASYDGEVTAMLDGGTIECDGANLSESGMLLHPRRARLALDRPIRLTFSLPRLSGSLTVEATLQRCEYADGRVAWAVRFTRVAPRIRRMLRTYVVVGHGAVQDYDEQAATA